MTQKKIAKNIPFLVCFIVISVLLCTFYISDIGDDNFFKNCNGKPFWEFLAGQFQGKSRIVIDFLLTAILRLPQWAWAIFSAFMFALIGYGVSDLFISDSSRTIAINWIISLLLLMYNFLDLQEAGWYATVANYVWPLACGLIAMIPVKNAIYEQSEQKWMYPIYLVCLLIGTNEEQMSAVVACFLVIFGIYLYKQKKLTRFIIAEAVISVLILLYMVFGPSNAERMVSEANCWFPDFLKLSIIDKCYLGFTLTSMDLIFTENPLVTAFVVLLPIFAYKMCNKGWVKGISLVPLIIESINNIFYSYFWRICPQLEQITDELRSYTTFGGGIPREAPISYSGTAVILGIIYTMTIIIAVYKIFEGSNKKYLAGLLILAGFASRYIMGFSPTVIGGGLRTAFFLYGSFVCVIAMMFEECKDNIDYSKLIPIMSSVAVLQILRLKYYTCLV